MRISEHSSDKIFKDLDDFKAGDTIDIEFTEFDVAGVQVMPRTRLRGILIDPVLATLRVEEVSPELDIDLPEIGLGVMKELERPITEFPLPTSQHKVAEGGTFSFFDPKDVDHEKRYAKVPYDRFNHRLARYGHLAINDTLIF